MLKRIATLETDLSRWKKLNRGMLRAIAKHCDVTRATVTGVLKQRYYSRGGLIEGLLADLGAPGMRRRQQEAEVKQKGNAWMRAEIRRLTRKLRGLQKKKRNPA